MWLDWSRICVASMPPGCYSNNGPLSEEFEERLCGALSLPKGCMAAAASGTAALVGAILSRAGRGTRRRPLAVIPSFTFSATACAVQECGYDVFLVDVDPDSWALDATHVATLPELDRTGVVVPVAPFGREVPQGPWLDFQRHTGIPVVIDGAASFEGLCRRSTSCVGEIPVVLSFHATKSFGTGEGGGVVSRNPETIEGVKRALNFGILDVRDTRSPSINGKMSEYHAAVGLAEIDGWIHKHKMCEQVWSLYRRVFDSAGCHHRLFTSPDVAGCYVLFECKSEQEAARVGRSLEANQIDWRLWYGTGLHRQTYFSSADREKLEITERIAPCILGLPFAPDLDEQAVTRIALAVTSAIE